ncbi:hypothetical protein PAMP_008612 [Pampus punctatissimus]
MATSPSTAQSLSSMEEQQPDQPISTQLDGEAGHAAVTSQPTGAKQQVPPPTMDSPEQTEEVKAMDQLTVISDNTETSNHTCPVLKHTCLTTSANIMTLYVI